jgi:DNA-binding beta-propeller fold protein YncE
MTMLTLMLLTALIGPPGPRIYVPNQDDATISIIDGRTRKLIETLDLRKFGMHDNAKPHHVQVERDGSAWYVTLIGEGKVLKFDRDNKLLGSVDMKVPGLITLNPTKDLMYVARSMSAVNPPQSMAIIRRSDMKLIDEIELLFPRPHGILAHPSGRRIYVTSLGTNQIASTASDGSDVQLIDLPGQAAHSLVQAAVSPNGRWLVVTGELTGKLVVFDLTNPAKPKLAHEIEVGAGAFEPVFTGGGQWVFVTTRMVNKVAVVNTKTWKVVDTITDSSFVLPHGIGMSADGKYVLIGNEHKVAQPMDSAQMAAHQGMSMAGSGTGPGSLAFVCALTRKVVAVVPVGSNAAGLGTAAPRGLLPAPTACR